MKFTREFDMQNAIDRAELIKIELRVAGLTAADIAEHLQVSKTFVGDVINSRRSSHRVRQHIAQEIKQPLELIWPKKRRNESMS